MTGHWNVIEEYKQSSNGISRYDANVCVVSTHCLIQYYDKYFWRHAGVNEVAIQTCQENYPLAQKRNSSRITPVPRLFVCVPTGALSLACTRRTNISMHKGEVQLNSKVSLCTTWRSAEETLTRECSCINYAVRLWSKYCENCQYDSVEICVLEK